MAAFNMDDSPDLSVPGQDSSNDDCDYVLNSKTEFCSLENNKGHISELFSSSAEITNRETVNSDAVIRASSCAVNDYVFASVCVNLASDSTENPVDSMSKIVSSGGRWGVLNIIPKPTVLFNQQSPKRQ